jgi:DNA-binding transcriptional ArsR family regulator
MVTIYGINYMVAPKSDDFEPRVVALARLAKALSHPARIAILEILAKKATCICGEIVEVIPLAQSTVSQHLKELKDAGLITGEIDGLKSCYCLNQRAVKELEKLSGSLLKVLKKGLNSNRCC